MLPCSDSSNLTSWAYFMGYSKLTNKTNLGFKMLNTKHKNVSCLFTRHHTIVHGLYHITIVKSFMCKLYVAHCRVKLHQVAFLFPFYFGEGCYCYCHCWYGGKTKSTQLEFDKKNIIFIHPSPPTSQSLLASSSCPWWNSSQIPPYMWQSHKIW